MPRPELGRPKIGDPVIVIEGNHVRRMQHSNQVIVKVGRQWVTIAPKDADGRPWTHGERRFRMDTQSDGGNGYGHHFRTPEQWKWEREASAANVYLREVAGLDIRSGGPFHRNPDLVISLARLLKDAEASWRPPTPE